VRTFTWIVAALLLVGIGVGGTLGVQVLAGDDEPSRVCEYWTEWTDRIPTADSLTNEDVEFQANLFLIRDRACAE